MTNRVYATPEEGRRVRDPLDNQPLPAEGKWVDNNRYFRRRAAVGDVKLTKSAPKKAAAAKKED